MSQELPPVSGPLKILSITAQKPHSTGSGVYLTELVQAFHRKGCRQAVLAGICGMILYASQTAFLLSRLLPVRAASLSHLRNVR